MLSRVNSEILHGTIAAKRHGPLCAGFGLGVFRITWKGLSRVPGSAFPRLFACPSAS